MSDNLFDFDDFEEDDWEEEDVNTIEPAKRKQGEVESDKKGQNVALLAFTEGGKSLTESLYGYLNSDFFDVIPDCRERFPKTVQMLKDGTLPQVEKLDILDLDGSYEKLSHKGIFGRLSKPLYEKGMIYITDDLEIPKVDVSTVKQSALLVAKKKIDEAKLKIEATISDRVKHNEETTLLAIDSMSSYDELLNDKFRILYEEVLADKKKKHVGSSLDGIKQSYWKIRNGWWVETLRNKRKYPGWQIDTYKLEEKQYTWLSKEIDGAKKHPQKTEEDVLPFKIVWAPRTTYDLDLVHLLRSDGRQYWMETMNRYKKNKAEAEFSLRDLDRIYYTPNRRSAVYEVLEELAPWILGEVEEGGELLEDDELW